MLYQFINNKFTWEKYLKKYPQANFLQSWYWGEVHQSLGCKIFRLGFFRKEKMIGLALIIKREARRGHYLECSGGPLFNDNPNNFIAGFAEIIKKIGIKDKCCFVRVRSQMLETEGNHDVFKENGFIASPMHLHAQTSWQLYITKPEEQLLKEMRKSTRYLIKKAIKDGVKITITTDPKDINWLYRLQLVTSKRHHFVPFPKKYFLEELKAFALENKIKLFKAIYQKQVLAVALIIFYGKESIYHYSGSSELAKKIPASYLMLWEAIKEAKKRNIPIFNFWGIAPNDNPRHRFAGVTLFKKGFGGFRVNYLPAYDLPINNHYWLIYAFETLRKIFRRL